MKVADINLAWLQKALASRFPEIEISGFELDDIGAGTGYGGTVLRATLDRTPAQLPNTVIIKLPVADPVTLQNLQKTHILLREAKFYRDFGSTGQLDIPEIFFVAINGDDFEIVMEDLGDNQRDDPLEDLTEAQIKLALTSVARLHSAYWNHDVLGEAWLAPITDGDAETRSENLDSFARAIEILNSSQHDVSITLDCAKRLMKLIPKAPVNTVLPPPVTLVHGDFHANNLHFSDNKIIVFDWQLTGKGTPMMDVANLLVSSCDPQMSEAKCEEFLDTYHAALTADGIRFSPRKMRRGFRDAMFFTFLKYLVVIGTIDLNSEDGERFKESSFPKIESCARYANARLYVRLMPIMFIMMKFVTLLQKIFRKSESPNQ